MAWVTVTVNGRLDGSDGTLAFPPASSYSDTAYLINHTSSKGIAFVHGRLRVTLAVSESSESQQGYIALPHCEWATPEQVIPMIRTFSFESPPFARMARAPPTYEEKRWFVN